MRILLDSRDLINLIEHGRPTSSQEFDAYLRGHNDEIVLTFTNVRELASPLAAGAQFLTMRPLLQSLEQTAHSCLKEVTIIAKEIQAGVDAFSSGGEYQGWSPYVRRWDQTLMTPPGQRGSPTDNWINLRLDEIIYYINRIRPDVFGPPSEHHAEQLQRTLESDRVALRAGRAPARQHFIASIKKHAATHGVPLPIGREDEFARWVYANPDRCPGLRLNHETYRALMANFTDIPEAADFSDLAHICALPYVEAATLDRRMRHYCRVAARTLFRFAGRINYDDRLYQDVSDVMRRHP